MDLTSEFKRLVAAERATSATSSLSSINEKHPSSFHKDLTRPITNAFLSEAYIIAKHLSTLRNRILDMRPAYLNLQRKTNRKTNVGAMQLPSASSEPPSVFARYGGMVKLSDPERDEIDRGIKTTIRQMLRKIQSLNELGEHAVEAMPEDDESGAVEAVNVLFHRLVAALDPRNAGASASSKQVQVFSKRDCMAALQSSVVWWLNSRLQEANQVHGEMQELYLRQKLERQHSVLSQQQQITKSSASSLKPAHMANMGTKTDDSDEVLKHLSEQELLQLQLENNNLVTEFESALNRIRETQRSIVEISTLQTQLANELNAQMQQTEKLYDEAVGAVDDVSHGNEYLVSARKHQASARKWVLVIFIVLSLVLLFLDWFD